MRESETVRRTSARRLSAPRAKKKKTGARERPGRFFDGGSTPAASLWTNSLKNGVSVRKRDDDARDKTRMRRVRDVDATGPGSAALANAPIADTCTVGRAPPWSRRGKSSTSRRLRRAAGAGGAGSAARDATRRGAHFSLLPSRAPSPWKKGLPGDAGRDLGVARGSGPDRASGRTVAVIQRLGPGPPRILAGGGARHRVHPGRAPGPREDSLSRRTTAAIFAGRV